ncbi:MAG: cupin domain-containing protein [Candidatus Dormibacteraeota bacterium]|nr:cupin domain-containing protein [Candidatus Dormibacteraeota bacterium]
MESTALPRVISNPMSGERIVVRQSGDETAGELLAFDLYLPPGARVPSGHTHPTQTERFTVISGQLRFRLGRRVVRAVAGQSVGVPPGIPHWFRNDGPGETHALVEVRPALRMQELFWESGRLGELHLGGLHLPAPRALARFLREFDHEVAVPVVPRWLVRPLLAVAMFPGGRRRRPR